MKLLRLITNGRKTGRAHETELYYFEHEDQFVVTASAGGRPSHPDWYLNILADPKVKIKLGKQTTEATARKAGPQLRNKLWAELIKMADIYAGYQKKTTRVIPMVLLQPKKASQ
jgi:deazaflavin-dependent oxidoreductase (nitroreductase family)